FFQRKTLEELAEQLNIDRPKNYVDPLLYHKYWVDERDKLIKYIGWRVRTLYKAFRALENDIYTLSSVTGIPPDYVLTSSSGRQIEFYIMNQAVRKGIIIPRVIERSVRSYQGGLVIKPVVGLHKNICVVDFKSMYPSIMIKYNISPETIVSSELDDSIFFKEVGLGVKTSVEGLFPEILRTLLRLRDDARDKLLKIPRSTPEYNLLDARQRIYKILANTVYGYMGWPQARWYSYEGASLVTYLGRKAISQAIKYAENLGLKVIYGDTDSLFIYYDEAVVEDLLNRIYEELGLEAKVDKIYRSILFTEAKKRYAGYTYEGNIDIVGLEYTRRDWCQYSRELQYEVVKAVLVDGDKKKAIDIFREYVSKLRKREIPLEKLVIWEQITRNLQDYKANSPHIEVAKNLERRGWRIRRGMFIGYIILKGSGPLYKRSTYYVDADIDDIDINYYIYSQLLPVVHRILSPLGVSRSSLEAVATGTGRGLDMFMG
ncbi:TPA: DNA polymerase II, partial [Candidatus Geothermarchaeota archaeon]|nr:DNA polymerase II [Candidatus Geothermarchaeota archaeon]